MIRYFNESASIGDNSHFHIIKPTNNIPIYNKVHMNKINKKHN